MSLIGDFDVKVIGEMPEHCDIHFITTGAMGGDAGHGGNSSITISQDSGTYQINVDQGATELYVNDDCNSTVTFTVMGDWELQGLVSALIRLGDKLRERYGEPTAEDEEEQAGG